MFKLGKIERQKRKFRDAYIKYEKHVRDLSCGETLANYISSTVYELRQKLIKEHKRMKELDALCPSLDTKLSQ